MTLKILVKCLNKRKSKHIVWVDAKDPDSLMPVESVLFGVWVPRKTHWHRRSLRDVQEKYVLQETLKSLYWSEKCQRNYAQWAYFPCVGI